MCACETVLYFAQLLAIWRSTLENRGMSRPWNMSLMQVIWIQLFLNRINGKLYVFLEVIWLRICSCFLKYSFETRAYRVNQESMIISAVRHLDRYYWLTTENYPKHRWWTMLLLRTSSPQSKSSSFLRLIKMVTWLMLD